MNRIGSGGALAAGTLFAVAATPAAAAQLDYTWDGGFEKNDNLALTSDDTIDRTIFRTGLGFAFLEDTSSIQANLDGRIDYRDYRDSHLHNRTEGAFEGRFNWSALPQRLDFTLEDSLSIAPVDTLAPDTPDNRQQVNVVSIGPTLHFRIGDALRGQAELRYIDSDAEVTEQFNSGRTALALRAIKDLSPTNLLSFNLQGQRVRFDHPDLARDYDLEEGYLHYASKLRIFDLALDAGYTRLRYRDGDSASEPMLRGSARWRPSPSSQFDLQASRYLSDSASAALADLTPGQTVPDTTIIGNGQITASAYRGREVSLGYGFNGLLTRLSLTGYREKRDYLDAGGQDETDTGLRGSATRRLSETLTLDAYLTYNTTDYQGTPRTDKTRYGGVGLERQWTRHWSTRLQYARYQRSSNIAGQDVSQNILYLSVVFRNR